MPSKIAPDLYVGSDPTAESIAAGKFGAVFLCARERQHPGETFPGVQVHRLPLPDFGPNDPLPRSVVKHAINTAHEIANLASSGTRTLVACREGESRSAWIGALALMSTRGVSADEAIARVRAARGDGALSDPRMVAVLKRFVGAPKAEQIH